MEYIIRKAKETDVDFIAKAIMAAERSGTERNGLASLLNMTEDELIPYVKEMLLSEVDGCEFSLSSFLIADVNNKPVAIVGGWLEGENEGGNSSAFLKTNMFNYYLPPSNLESLTYKSSIMNGLIYEREKGSYQIEYVYTAPHYRGMGIVSSLLKEHEKSAIGHTTSMFIQVCNNNISAVNSYRKYGFRDYLQLESKIVDARIILPDNKKIVMLKNI